MAIHFPGLKTIDQPVVLVFSELTVCSDCGSVEFVVPKSELRQLLKGNSAAG
jgi:hypothetical protein